MALALRSALPLKTEIRLAQAVSEFEAGLDNQQKATFRNNRSTARVNPPALKDVMQVTAEMDRQAHLKHKASRSFGPRFTNILQSVQQYAALGDVVVGGSQNLVACGVWAAVRMMLQLSLGHLSYLERLSELFMEAGRQAPRHNAMALIYPKSKALQDCLSEYYIVVVKICQQIQTFIRKPMLGRMMCALDDTELKRLQADLLIWSTSISGQVEVLCNESLVNEAREASKARELLTKWSDSEIYRKHLGNKVQWMDACSAYDHQTTWKQTRKKGTSSLLSTWLEYQSWKHDTNSSAMLLSGKVGAGKSVTMANIVDDLSFEKGSTTIYFFCRHDISESLNCRTIIGSLARQYLSHLPIESHLFTDDIPLLDIFAMTELMRSTVNQRRTYLLVDGIDECHIEDRRSLLQCLAQLQNVPSWHLGFSVRLSAEDIFGNDIKKAWHIRMPDNNPDIENYVEIELARRKNTGELVTRDPQLISAIREALVQGSKGMFLWASLQIDAVCSEATDHDIRQALRSLPKDLTETYTRILRNSSSLDHKYHHVRLFKFITAAFEPLSLPQIQDIMSVTVGDTLWNPNKLINDITKILKFCGSLVTVDEEEQTVRFVHHTARSFCLGALGGNLQESLPFTEIEAHQELGGTTVTYLNYGIFDRQISTVVSPKIDARHIPEQITHRTIGRSRLTTSLFKRKPEETQDIGHVLASLVPLRRTGHRSENDHPFYPYALRFWLLQSRHLVSSDIRGLWRHLMHNIDAISFQSSGFTPYVPGVLDNLPVQTPTPEYASLAWALNYSHLFLFDHVMASKRSDSLSARSLMRRFALFHTYFKALSLQSMEFFGIQIMPEMIWRILPIAIDLRYYKAIKRIAECGLVTAPPFPADRHVADFAFSSSQSEEDLLQEATLCLVQSAALAPDVRMLRFLVERDFCSVEGEMRMIEALMKSQVTQEALLRSCYILTRIGSLRTSSSSDLVYAICHHVTCSPELNSDMASVALQSVMSDAERIPNVVYDVFRQACSKGNLMVALVSWPSKRGLEGARNRSINLFHGDELQLVLKTISQDRSEIAHKLLDDDDFSERLVPGSAINRAVVLKDWHLAKRLMNRGANSTPLINFLTGMETLHHCVLAVDLGGLDFLLSIGMRMDQVSIGPTFAGRSPAELLKECSSWSCYQSLKEMIQEGVEPKQCSSGGPNIVGLYDMHQIGYLDAGWNTESVLIRLLQTDVIGQADSISEACTARAVCIVAAAARMTVTSCFSFGTDTIEPEPEDITSCLGHLAGVVTSMQQALRHAGPSVFSYPDILWSIDEIVRTIEDLHQPHGRDPVLEGFQHLPDPRRFAVQTMLLQVVDVVLRNHLYTNLGENGAEVIWNDFSALLSRGRIGASISNFEDRFKERNVEFKRHLQLIYEKRCLPWMLQCMLLLGENHSPSALKRYVGSIQGLWPRLNYKAKDPNRSLSRMETLVILRELGCSDADYHFLYDKFGTYF